MRTAFYGFFIALVFLLHSCGILSSSKSEVNVDKGYSLAYIYSPSMDRTEAAYIFTPKDYNITTDSFPVVYLLHGWSGAYHDWFRKEPLLPDYADKYNMIIVTPEGEYASWYLNAKEDIPSHFETYIANEVPAFIEKNFRIKKDNHYHAITGLSMGGHGAMHIAINHPDKFGHMGSMSGVLDLKATHLIESIEKLIGPNVDENKNWRDLSVIFQLEEIDRENPPSIIFDCGLEDKYIVVNRNVNKKLTELGIPHQFNEEAGGHSWEYWKKMLPAHLEFFNKAFSN